MRSSNTDQVVRYAGESTGDGYPHGIDYAAYPDCGDGEISTGKIRRPARGLTPSPARLVVILLAKNEQRIFPDNEVLDLGFFLILFQFHLDQKDFRTIGRNLVENLIRFELFTILPSSVEDIDRNSEVLHRSMFGARPSME